MANSRCLGQQTKQSTDTSFPRIISPFPAISLKRKDWETLNQKHHMAHEAALKRNKKPKFSNPSQGKEKNWTWVLRAQSKILPACATLREQRGGRGRGRPSALLYFFFNLKQFKVSNTFLSSYPKQFHFRKAKINYFTLWVIWLEFLVKVFTELGLNLWTVSSEPF